MNENQATQDRACYFCGTKTEYKTETLKEWEGITLKKPYVIGYYVCPNPQCGEYFYPAKYVPRHMRELDNICKQRKTK
jgi:hypothetical protein